MNKVAIIGGGASGIMAAIIAAKNPQNSVTIYEREKRIGKKILATGNGRCNMTNIYADIDNYHGTDKEFIKDAISSFWVSETLDFFTELGILYKVEDEGKVYPYSDQASAVLDVLRAELDRNRVNIITEFEVKNVKKYNSQFIITSYKGNKEYADKVVVSTGGKAAPDLGSNGSGYELLKAFGHHITDLKPSLVQIKTEGEVCKKLKGIKVNAVLKLGNLEKEGEILFTEYGLSGPPIFSLSAYLDKEKTLALDIMPEYSGADLENIINERISRNPDTLLENFFVGMLNKRVGQVLLKEAGVYPLSRNSRSLTEEEIKNIIKYIKNFEFVISGTMSWNNAQTTKGGAKTCEFNRKNLESKLMKGLFATGEILDIDGDCGGFNLQWAWTSGYLVGSYIKGE